MKKAVPYLIGGGVLTGVTAWLAHRQSQATVTAIENAVQGKSVDDSGRPVQPTFKARLTGYWPFTARADERQMEGGLNDRAGKPLHTLEDVQAGKADYVSVSGDDAIFPYGQRLSLDVWPGIVFRVTDTGKNFRGAGKVYRLVGAEPLDVCVYSSKTKVPTTATATLYPGDHFAKKGLLEVATGKFRDQTVAGVVEGRTQGDREALARALESDLGGRTHREKEAAAWVLRNRAAEEGVSLEQLLVPRGQYGAADRTGGFTSTRKAPSSASYAVADQVLGAEEEDDLTEGATDYWMPHLQATLSILNPQFEDVATVRVRHAHQGLEVAGCIGAIELLRRNG